VYAALYLNYDMGREYDEQFRMNSEKLIETLDQLPLREEDADNE
jgi:hypothetical protein